MAGNGILGQLRVMVGLDNSGYKTKLKETEGETTKSTVKIANNWETAKNATQSFGQMAGLKSAKTELNKFSVESSRVFDKYIRDSVDAGSRVPDLIPKIPPIDPGNEIGKTARSFNGLNVQAQMLARELPALALSPQMFFLAISNNLPMLTDEIKKVTEANKLLAAEGKKGIPVWQQVAKSFLNWQTALVVGITLLVAYGKEITTWVGSLFAGEQQALSTADAVRNINDELKEGAGVYGENVATIRRLSEMYKALNTEAEKKEFIKKYREEVEKTGIALNSIDEAEILFVKKTEDVIKGFSLRSQAAAAAALAQKEFEKSLLAEVAATEKADEGASNLDKALSGLVKYGNFGALTVGSLVSFLSGGDISSDVDKTVENAILKLEEKAKSYKDAGDKYNEIQTKLLADAEALLDGVTQVDGGDSLGEDLSKSFSSVTIPPIDFTSLQSQIQKQIADSDLLRLRQDVYTQFGIVLDPAMDISQQIQDALNEAIDKEISVPLPIVKVVDSLNHLEQAFASSGLGQVVEDEFGNKFIDAQKGVEDAIAGFASSIGAAAKSEDPAQTLRDGLISPVVDALGVFGQALIAAGIGKIALDGLTSALGGVGAIAAGTALVALSGAAKMALSNVSNPGSGGSGYVDTFSGGGGYSEGTPDWVSNQMQTVTVEGDFRLAGKDLVASVTKTNAYNSR